MERIKSVIEGKDSDVLKKLFEFYPFPEGKIVDLTCNAKRMWDKTEIKDVIFCDIDPQFNPDIICDFCNTPFENESVSVLVFDPPHLPMAAASPKSLPHFVKNYGLKKSVHDNNISSIFPTFLNEAKRILKPDGLIFAKLADFVHNHAYQWTLVDFVNAVRDVDGLTPCDLIIKRDPVAGNLKSSKWKNNYHSRKCHCWWIIVRKGKCEPKK